MAGNPREFLMVVQETAYKTAISSPTVWTTGTTYGLANYQAIYIRLDGGNAFTMRPRPVQVEVPYGGGLAIGAFRVADKLECKGQLTTKLYIGQAPMLLSWAGVRINSGLTAPWTTTSSVVGDLASCSIYHAIERSDGTFKRRVYLGTKVDSWNLAVSEDSTVATLTMGLSASTPQGNQFDSSTDPSAGTFPSPADNNFPIDPYMFIHTAGVITIGGSARTQITDLTVSVQNTLARRFFNSRFVQFMQFVGRKTTVASKLLYAPTPDDRTNYEGLTSETVSVEMSNGTHNFTMNLNAQNVFDPLEDDLALGDLYFETNTENNLWDPSAGSDFTLTFA